MPVNAVITIGRDGGGYETRVRRVRMQGDMRSTSKVYTRYLR